jgi:hypothetical protein
VNWSVSYHRCLLAGGLHLGLKAHIPNGHTIQAGKRKGEVYRMGGSWDEVQ